MACGTNPFSRIERDLATSARNVNHALADLWIAQADRGLVRRTELLRPKRRVEV